MRPLFHLKYLRGRIRVPVTQRSYLSHSLTVSDEFKSRFEGPSVSKRLPLRFFSRDPKQGSYKHRLPYDETNHLLKDISLGKMEEIDISRCISLLFFWASKQTLTGAQTAEDLLERLVAEKRDGDNSLAHIDSRMYNAIIGSYGACDSKSGPEKAEEVFNRMMDRYYAENESARSDAPKPDQATLNTLMNVWAQSNRPEAVFKNEQILNMMEADESLLPDDVSYNNMMNTYANQLGEYGYAKKAEDILLKMSSLQKDGKTGINPDTRSFNIVLKAWKNGGGGIESAHRAHDILRLMMKLFSDGHIDVKPDAISFKTVMYAYLKPHGEIRELTPDIIDQLESVADLLIGDPILSVDSEMVQDVFSVLFHYISLSNIEGAGERALRIMDKMNAISQRNSQSDNLHMKIISNIMGSCLQSKDTAEKAFEIFERIENDPSLSLHFDPFLLNKFLSYFVSNGDIEGAEAWFHKMEMLAKSKNLNTSPNYFSYRTMTYLYSQLDHDAAAKKTISLFDKMVTAHNLGELKELDSMVFKSVLLMLPNSKDEHILGRAYEIIKLMVDLHQKSLVDKGPDKSFFSLALLACSKGRKEENAEQAMKVLDLMGSCPEVVPDTQCFQHAIVALIRNMNSDTSRTLTSIADQICTWIASGRTNVLLDKALCETLFQGFSHPIHGDRLASNKLLTQILNLRKRGFQDSVSEPTPRMLNLILKAYCSNKKGEQKYVTSLGAHRFLKQLINKYEKKDLSVLPDRVGINNVIHCWSGTRHNQAVENAEYLFRLMKRLSIDHPQLSPDKFTYTSLLSVFSRNNYLANIAPRAQKWFDSFDRIDVDQATYNALLTVWSKSSKAEKVKRSREILDSMKKGRISGVDSYNIVINTCASSQENKSDALIAATDTFRELLTSYTPNAWSFIAMSRAIHNLSSNTDEKIQLSRVLFSQACRYGLFSEQLMKEILFSVKDDEARKEIFESHDPLKPYKDLPKHWKQNVTLGM